MNKGSGNFIALSILGILFLTCLGGCERSTVSSEVTSRDANQKTLAGSRQPSTSQTPSVPNTREDENPSLDEARMVAHGTRYSNYEYAYAVDIPNQLKGFSDPSPMPQHGMGITLSKEPKSYIWVDGSYNAAFLGSLDEAINQELEFLAKDGIGLEVRRREKTKLQKLPAMRSTVRYKSIATGEIRVKDVIVAFRPYEGQANGITYTVGLIAPEHRYNEDVVVLEQMVKAWRIKPLPRPW